MPSIQIDVRLADLGEDVIYAVHRAPTRHVVVFNTRPLTTLNANDPPERADAAPAR